MPRNLFRGIWNGQFYWGLFQKAPLTGSIVAIAACQGNLDGRMQRGAYAHLRIYNVFLL